MGDFGAGEGNGDVEAGRRSLEGEVGLETTSRLVMSEDMTSAPNALEGGCWARRLGEACRVVRVFEGK